jgi:hypothetical protein
MTFQDTGDFNINKIFCLLSHFKFLKCQKSLFSCPGLPVYSQTNFTYSFPKLKIILIPTKIRSNHFSCITFIARTGPPMPETLLLWHDSKREKMQLKVLDLFIFASRRYSHVHGFTEEFKVIGYTTFKVYDNAFDNLVKYYANEYHEWSKEI